MQKSNVEKKLNILIVTDAFPPHCGGSGWSTYALCLALRDRGHKITIVRPNKYTRKERYDYFNVYNISSKLGNEFVHLSMRKIIKKIIGLNKFDLIHAQHIRSVMACSDNSIKIPKVATIRDHWPIFYSGTWYNVKKDVNFTKYNSITDTFSSIFNENGFVLKMLSPLASFYMWQRTKYALLSLRKMDKIICVSNFIKDYLSNVIDKKKLLFIPNMVEPEKESNFNKFRKNILFYGKHNKQKGFHIFIEAICNLDNKSYDKVIVAGEGQLREFAEEKFKENNVKYEFTGHIENRAELMNYIKNSINVIPSLWHEPLGRNHLEALSSGGIIISTNTGGTPDIINHNKNGLIFDGSADDLKKKLDVVLNNKALQKKLSINAYSTALNKFNKNVLVEKYIKLYNSLTDN